MALQVPSFYYEVIVIECAIKLFMGMLPSLRTSVSVLLFHLGNKFFSVQTFDCAVVVIVLFEYFGPILQQ